MDSNFTQQLIGLDNSTLVVRAMMERRAEILGSIGDCTLEPTEEVMRELAELNIAIGDVPVDDASDE